MQPVGKWRIEEPVQEAPVMPVGKWRIEPQEIDTSDTETFQAHMMLDEALEREDAGVAAPRGVWKVEKADTESAVRDILKPHLEAAEGNIAKVYQGKKDKEGVLTAGIGHKLTAEELQRFSEGDDITAEQVQKWYEEDSKKAVGAAIKQAKEIGEDSPKFMSALASVNFQLGTNWKGEHKATWKLMKEGKFEEAAEEAANSKWNTQTPKRVEAFQDALRNL